MKEEVEEHMITLENISKKYGAFYAVDNVSCTFKKGQVTGLLGQNGAGKSTILNMITGYIGPSQGNITIGGYNLLEQPRMAKELMGYLPEQPPLYDEMTVGKYLAFCCDLKAVQKSEIKKHIEEIAHTLGIEDILHRVIGHLSKGYRQRVGIAQALCGAPEVLIFDEPTVGLDPKQIIQLRELVKALGKKHTVIFSSHILQDVQALCEEVLILHKGKLIKKVTPKELGGGKQKTFLLDITVLKEAQNLLPALQSLSAIARVFPQRVQDSKTTQLVLECKKDCEPEKQLFTLLSGLDAPILHMVRREDTLEDVFLRVTSQADSKEAQEVK